MLKKYFIPILVALLFVVVVIYYISGGVHHGRDLRSAIPVEKFTLRNGMTLVVMPNSLVPIVTHKLVVKAGSADDPQGKSGLAHYLEHLLFTGTELNPEGVYEQTIAKIGGAQNAYTSRDETVYFSTVPADKLDVVMALEADRLAHLEFAEEKAARELKVITEERGLRIENNPVSLWAEQLEALTFLNHPYGQPTIGWAEDMATFTAEDATAFFEHFYRPSNMVLVVAGDVKPRDVRRLAERYYGGLIAGDALPRQWAKEPPARLKRHGEMRDARVNQPRLKMQFVAPSVRDGESKHAIPLAVFAQYLGGGDASVLYSRLVREQKLATSIYVTYEPLSIGPATFEIVAIPAPGIEPKTLEDAIAATLENVLKVSPNTDDIVRAKTLLSAQITFAQDGIEGLAGVMARLYAIGLDEQFFYEWAENIEKVTPEDARLAARATLVMKRSVTGTLLPETEVTHAP